MNDKTKHMLASYARSYIVAMATMIAAGQDDLKKMAITAFATAIIGPAIRAINPNDPAFGYCAALAEKEVEKVATANLKKVKKK